VARSFPLAGPDGSYGNLAEGAKKTFAELPREEQHLRIVDWQEYAAWNE